MDGIHLWRFTKINAYQANINDKTEHQMTLFSIPWAILRQYARARNIFVSLTNVKNAKDVETSV